MEKKNIIKVYTTSSGAELNISTPNTKQIISATNNRAQYFAELAKKYRDEAQQHRDNAKYYAEQNSDVTFEYINNVRSSLENKISEKQDLGDYALRDELPTMVGELENNMNYINLVELEMAIDEVKLPEQVGNEGKFLMTDGEKEKWVGISTFKLFDIKLSDHVLTYEESKGWALQGTYVYKEALAGSRYGYPDFYAKCLEEFNGATNTETINGVTVKIHSNGHKFYNISDKTAIDEFFNSVGSAWFYGVDIENERIFLPRNNFFDQATGDTNEVGKSVEAGLPDHTHTVTVPAVYGQGHGAGTPLVATAIDTVFETTGAEESNPIYGNSDTVQPNAVKKLLYICVGNTTNYEGLTDVVNQGMEILEQVNQGIESRVKLDGSNAEFIYVTEAYQNGTSWYRIWSDGWCEQGGAIDSTASPYTVSLLKTYSSIEYSISCTFVGNTYSNDSGCLLTSSQTTSSFKVVMPNDNLNWNFFWETRGYIW